MNVKDFKTYTKYNVKLNTKTNSKLEIKTATELEFHKSLLGIESAVLTVSDRASKGIYEDKSGIIIKDILTDNGSKILDYTIVPDDQDEIFSQIKNVINKHNPSLIITTGGTGLCKRDITPTVVESMCTRILPGIGEALRYYGAKFTPNAWTSNCMGGLINTTLIICLPGNPNAVLQSMDVILEFLPNAFFELKS